MKDFTLKKFPSLDLINESDIADDDGYLVYDKSIGIVKRTTKAQSRSDRVTSLSDITSLSSLNTAALVDGQQFWLKEWWPGTGVGGGPHTWKAGEDSANHNGGTIKDPRRGSVLDVETKEFNGYHTAVSGNAGCFVVTSPRPFTITNFGAVNSGGVDSHEAIQATINSAPVTGFFGGTTVYFPAGYYRVSDTLVIPHENIYLEGAGADTTTLRAFGDFPSGEFLIRTSEDATDANPIRRWGVSAMLLDGLGGVADGIGVIDGALVDFDRLIIRSVRDGIVIESEVEPTDVTIFQPGGAYITNCRLDCDRNSIVLRWITQVWIMDNWFVGSGAEQILIDKGDKVKIQGNEFNNWVGDCILMTSDDSGFQCEKHLIESNTFYNSGTGNAVREDGFCRYNNVQANSSWAGEGFIKISDTSMFKNNLGSSADSIMLLQEAF